MKKILLVLLSFLIVLISCKTKDNKSITVPPKSGRQNIVAVYTLPDSTRNLEVLARFITIAPKYDSSAKKYIVVIDTIWNIVRNVPKQVNGKPVLDSAGKQVLEERGFIVNKDSVRWQISGIPTDSLLNKKSPTH